MYWYMTCRYYGGVDIWYPSLGRQMYRIGSRQYWWGLGIYQYGISPLLSYQVWQVSMVYQHGGEQGIIAPPIYQVLHVHTILLSPDWRHHITYYYIQLLVGNTRYHTRHHYYYTYIYILLLLLQYTRVTRGYRRYSTNTLSIYHVSAPSTTYTLVILAIYCWGASISILLSTTAIGTRSIGIYTSYYISLPTIYHTLHYICIHVM